MSKELLLNHRQKAILSYIQDTLQQRGYPPSVREIGEAVGLSSSSTVHNHLNKLEDLGVIRRDPTKPRAIEVLLNSDPWRHKPLTPVSLVGQVAAGLPIMAVENIEETYPMPAELLGVQDPLFMLNVKGDSMVQAGICNGDYVIVREQSVAQNGDIIVALVGEDQEATVKRYYKEKDHIRLQPENDAFEPIISRQVTVVGKVVGLFRRL